MPTRALSSDQLAEIADRFQALGDVSRLSLLQMLRGGERSVTELTAATALSQSNVSKHLQLLLRLGFVRRRRDGNTVRYRLADGDVVRLCDLMCDRVAADALVRRKLLAR